MLLCMRTTLDISDGLLIQAKTEAVKRGTSLKKVVEQALRRMFAAPARKAGKTRFDFPVFDGRAPFLADVNDRRALYDKMDGLA